MTITHLLNKNRRRTGEVPKTNCRGRSGQKVIIIHWRIVNVKLIVRQVRGWIDYYIVILFSLRRALLRGRGLGPFFLFCEVPVIPFSFWAVSLSRGVMLM